MPNLDEKAYTYLQDGERHGPYTLEELGEKALHAEIAFDQVVTPVDESFAGVPLASLPVPDPVFRQTWERLRTESQERTQEPVETAVPPIVPAARVGAGLALIALRVFAIIMFLGGLYALPGPLYFRLSAESTEGVLTAVRQRYGRAYQYQVDGQTYTGTSYGIPMRPLKAAAAAPTAAPAPTAPLATAPTGAPVPSAPGGPVPVPGEGGASAPAVPYQGRAATEVGDPVVVYYNRHSPASSRLALPEIGGLLAVFLVATGFLGWSVWKWWRRRGSKV